MYKYGYLRIFVSTKKNSNKITKLQIMKNHRVELSTDALIALNMFKVENDCKNQSEAVVKMRLLATKQLQNEELSWEDFLSEHYQYLDINFNPVLEDSESDIHYEGFYQIEKETVWIKNEAGVEIKTTRIKPITKNTPCIEVKNFDIDKKYLQVCIEGCWLEKCFSRKSLMKFVETWITAELC